jgi:calmodulin
MIWEVDDDCDKAVNWSEFQAMYNRCRNDRTGSNSHPISLFAH